MLLAINIGNTHTSAGLWDGRSWVAKSKRVTDPEEGSEHVGQWLRSAFGPAFTQGSSNPQAWAASVVPGVNNPWRDAVSACLEVELRFLEGSMDLGVPILYDPPGSVGADRLANVLGALSLAKPPLMAVDFGTATTIEVVDASGSFVGGAILPGAGLAAEALAHSTSQLRKAALQAPPIVIGGSTDACLQSGVVIGHACAVDGLIQRMSAELGQAAPVFATGGLSELFVGICKTSMRHEPDLTLLGLLEAQVRMGGR